MKFMVKTQYNDLVHGDKFDISQGGLQIDSDLQMLGKYATTERTAEVYKDLEEWIRAKIAISQCSYEMAGIDEESGTKQFDAFIKTAIFTFPKE